MDRRTFIGAIGAALPAGCTGARTDAEGPLQAVTPAPVPTDDPTVVPAVTVMAEPVSESINWEISAEPRQLADGRTVFDVTLVGTNAADVRVTDVEVRLYLMEADGDVVDRVVLVYDRPIEPMSATTYPARTTGPFDAAEMDRVDRTVIFILHHFLPTY